MNEQNYAQTWFDPFARATSTLDAMKALFYFVVIMSIPFVGCTGLGGQSYQYGIGVKNTGKQEIFCSQLFSSKGSFPTPGRLIPGAVGIVGGPFPYPYRDHFTVVWKAADGKTVSKTLDLTQAFPTPLIGDLIFTIDTTNNLGYFVQKY